MIKGHNLAPEPMETDLASVPRISPTHHAMHLLPALQSLLNAVIVGLFLVTFTLQPIRIPSQSMEPTLLVGDFLLLDKQAAAPGESALLPPVRISRGDVVVFHDPVGDPSIHLVKRVVAVPGDRLHLRDGILILNGQPIKEAYAMHQGATATDSYRDDFPDMRTMDVRVNPRWWVRLRSLIQNGDLLVPAGSYFVMGDNRNDSEDSRYWGFVPRNAIVGKPVLVYFSLRELQARRGQIASFFPLFERNSTSENKESVRWERILRVIR